VFVVTRHLLERQAAPEIWPAIVALLLQPLVERGTGQVDAEGRKLRRGESFKYEFAMVRVDVGPMPQRALNKLGGLALLHRDELLLEAHVVGLAEEFAGGVEVRLRFVRPLGATAGPRGEQPHVAAPRPELGGGEGVRIRRFVAMLSQVGARRV